MSVSLMAMVIIYSIYIVKDFMYQAKTIVYKLVILLMADQLIYLGFLIKFSFDTGNGIIEEDST